jgi:uncharacterized protein
MQFLLTQINIYPVKSLGGISLGQAIAGERGFQYDRRWMITDTGNVFITQREVHSMALIRTALSADGIVLYKKDNAEDAITIPYEIAEGEAVQATIWNDICTALHYNKHADEWLSDALSFNCKLLFMPEYSGRLVDPKFASGNEPVSFADGYPYLIIGENSLQDLNNRLEEALPMNRFRPNLVFSGGQAFCEDKWHKITIGNVEFCALKPCSRCQITTINQDTGMSSKEPLKTLATFRQVNNNILFGMNLIAVTKGEVKVGDYIYAIPENE